MARLSLHQPAPPKSGAERPQLVIVEGQGRNSGKMTRQRAGEFNPTGTQPLRQ
jgi:hypothetical protein